MRKYFFCFVVFVLCMGCGLFRKPLKLVCYCEEEHLKDTIQQMFDADSILIYTKLLREELYMPEIRAIVVCVVNGTTDMLDFRTLTKMNQRFENYTQIENSLQQEAKKVALLLFEKCNTKEFNDIIVEFFKYGDDGIPNYRFVTHHYDLFGNRGVYSDSKHVD